MESNLGIEPTVFIGIDQSYGGFGISFIYEGCGCKDETLLWKFPPEGSDGARLFKIYQQVNYAITEYYADHKTLVAMEGYAHGAKFGREKLGELGAAVKMAAYDVENDGQLLVVSPTVLKKFVTGKGVASKKEMVITVNQRWGKSFEDDNMADSYALAQYLKEQHART